MNNLQLTRTRKRKASVMLMYILFLASSSRILSQEENSEPDYSPISIGAHLKNMHIWHGFVVHQGAVIATNLEYNSKNEKLTFGFWGGASFSGTDILNNAGEIVSAHYKELAIYAKYRVSDQFFIEAVSHNNYTGVEERGDKLNYWSYDKTQGYNFVDIGLGYNVFKNTSLYLATIIGGGAGDYEIQNNGALKDSWTHYFEVDSKIWRNDNSELSVFVGGAWSFVTDKTFYTENVGNIVNVGTSFSKDVIISNYILPVVVTAMWNPERKKTVLQLDITLFW